MAATAPLFSSKHRLTVDEYYRMAETGILSANMHSELIEGEIIDMAPIGSQHASAVTRLNQLLVRAAGDLAIVWAQNPVRLNEQSEPEPDLALLKPRRDYYRDAHPTPADVLLIIEVADSSIRYDREIKIPLYAKSGIPEVWLVDIEKQQLEIFCEPGASGYAKHEPHQISELISPQALPEFRIDISHLFA